MSAAKPEAAAKTRVPAAAESGTRAIRRIRLTKALAATAKATIPGMTRPPKHVGAKETKGKRQKPQSHRYKLTDDEHGQLTALKRRLEALGSSVKRSELLRVGLLLLAAMDDEQLKMMAALAGVGKPVSVPRQAA